MAYSCSHHTLGGVTRNDRQEEAQMAARLPQPLAAVTDVAKAGGKTVVTGLVSGNFPGSPVRLRHEFTFDRRKIARLEIG
jgi:hypothetical protein